MLNTTKSCTMCNTIKNIKYFRKDERATDLLTSRCNICLSLASKNSRRKKIGKLCQIYSSHKKSHIIRKINKVEYSRDELIDWAMSQQLYHTLHKEWEMSGYNKYMAPSVDRIDDYQGYNLVNIQLMTWGENRDKYCFDQKNGINKKRLVPIAQINTDNKILNTFLSISIASRHTRIDTSSIIKCCQNKRKTAGGFKWEYIKW